MAGPYAPEARPLYADERAGVTAPTPVAGAVLSEVDGLADDIGKLGALISQCEDRLELVVAPSEPRDRSIGMDDLPPDAAPLARRLHDIRQEARSLQERIDYLTRRVQL